MPEVPDDDLVMSLVETTLSRPPDTREDYLRGECAGNTELFGQVWDYVQWEERMKGFLLEPLCQLSSAGHTFQPGTLLDGRFRIVREVAEGGMGVVYEAKDEKLDRRIALKCAKLGFSKRLSPEVRNAREIAHPNVCKIFEIHTTNAGRGEMDFITMEFLEGQTLAERLRKGPLPEEQARTIAGQLAAGLAEAHRMHVVHGDLKSGNVILNPRPEGGVRAVITDFGLARDIEKSRSGTNPTDTAGTPDYMAPELFQGAKVSAASDVYALGVILFEMVSGRRPHGPEVLIEQRFTRRPPPAHAKWDRVLGGCLDPNPAKRFRDGAHVAQALAPRSRRSFLIAAAAVVLAAITGWVTYEKATAPSETVRLAVLPIESGEGAGSLAEGFLRDTTAQVGGLRGNSQTSFKVVPLSSVLSNQADSAEKASAKLGATHVLQATVLKLGGRVTLHGLVTGARSHVEVKEWTMEYDAGQERYIPAALAGLVSAAFHLSPPAGATTVNSAARQDYAAGLAHLRRDSGVPTALACFERAARADPDSPLTYAGLAEAQWFKFFLTKDRAWLERSAVSAVEAERRNPDLAPVHRVTGLHLANTGFYEQAAAEYRRAIELEPKNAETYRRLGQVYEQNNQKEQALAAFRTAIALQPDYYRALYELGAYYYNRGDYSGAVAPLQKAVELAPDEPNVRFGLGAAYLNLGSYGEAEQQLRLGLGLDETPNALHSLGLTLMYESRDKEAIAYFSRALRRNPESYLSWMYLGITYRRTKRLAEAGRANRRGQQLAEAEMARNPRSGYVRSILGYFAAALGDRVRAESETAQALHLLPDDAETRWFAVLTYEALGQREATLAALSRSSRQQLVDFSRWPDLAGLQKDSRFTRLVAAHQFK